MDYRLIRRKRGLAVCDRYPNAVQYVIAVRLKEYLHAIRRDLRQKTADPRLPSRMQMSLGILYQEQPAYLCTERRNDYWQRI